MKDENPFLHVLKVIGRAILNFFLKIAYAFRDLGIGIWHGIKNIGLFFKNFVIRFKKSSIWTKVSHFIMGFGNIARKQFVKGFIFLAVEVLFIVFMVTSPKVNGVPFGAKAVGNFFTLGEEAGMKISQAGSYSEEFTSVIAFPDDLEANETKETYAGTLSQIVRSRAILDAISESENNDKITIEDNAEGKLINPDNNTDVYDPTKYQKIVTDNRYGTNDKYGYTALNKDGNILMNVTSIYTLWFESSTEIQFSQDNIDFYLVNDRTPDDYTEESRVDAKFGVFAFNENSEENGYFYFVLVQTPVNSSTSIPARRAKIRMILNDTDNTYDNATISMITYDNRFVNTSVDNSFLMMLFGITTFAVIGIFIAIYSLNIKSSFKTDQDIAEGIKPTTFLDDLKSLLDGRFHITMLAPAIIFLVVFTIVPTVLMILIAFTNMDSNEQLSGARLIDWNGMQNFVNLFSGGVGNKISKEVGRNFLPVLGWTLSWALIATFSCYFGGIFLALLINRKDIKLKKFWRTIFILTIAVPQFITLLIMKNILKDSGPINTLLMNLHWISQPVDFLQQGSGGVSSFWDGGVWMARITVLVINLYIGIPYTMLMTSGILMNIPADLYEAATIDGANKFQMFQKITLPYVIFVTTPYLISSFIGNITSFNTIFLTTGGGPNLTGQGNIAGTTDLLVTWLYKMTINEYVYNAGSIIGILTFIITATISLICYRNSKAYKEEDTFQ